MIGMARLLTRMPAVKRTCEDAIAAKSVPSAAEKNYHQAPYLNFVKQLY